jgi:hypothetical protein
MLNVLPPEWESVAMNIAEAFVAEGEARGKAEGEANALNNTRQAIELMGKGVSLQEIAQQTGLALEMLQFLREHMAH